MVTSVNSIIHQHCLGHAHQQRVVAVSPDSQFFISGACGRVADGVVRIWTAAGDFVRKLQGKTCVPFVVRCLMLIVSAVLCTEY